jgi:TolB-like protein/tetratricopeptide (TPR) repeat protein
MADIFISYSSLDRAKAEQLIELLTSAGLSVWIDRAGIEAAESWSEAIVEAIDSCKALVVLLSSNSIVSHNVVKELSLASEKRKKILPIDLEPIEIPKSMQYPLAGVQRTSMQNIDGIIRALGKLGFEATSEPKLTVVKEVDTRKSLMILPFADLSPTGDNEWFADGLVSELISALSNVKSLRVSDATMTKDFKNYSGPLSNYARDMNIRYFVQGDVRKFGENIKISSRLIDIQTGDFLWQDALKGTMDDIFLIQEQVAEKVVSGLKVILTDEEREKISDRGTENPEAYELSFLAKSYIDLNTKQGLLNGVDLLEEAIELDPKFAMAHMQHAFALTGLYRGYIRDTSLLERAQNAIDNALRIDPAMATAYSVSGFISLLQNKADDAITAGRKAVELAPNNFMTHFQLGFIYNQLLQKAEAAEAFENALTIQPGNLAALYNLALDYEYLGQKDELKALAKRAIPYFEKHLRRHPNDSHNRTNYAVLLSSQGRVQDCKNQLERIMADDTIDGNICYNCACLMMDLKEYETSLALLNKAVDRGFARKEIFTETAFPELAGTEGWTNLQRRLEERELAAV